MASSSHDQRLELLQGTLDMLILRTLLWGPQHGHGMTRRASVSRGPGGLWRAEGLLFHMPGEWRLYFDVRRGALLERAEARVLLD